MLRLCIALITQGFDVLLFGAACGQAEGGRQQAAGAVGPAHPDPGPDEFIIFLLPDEAGSAATAASTEHLVHKPIRCIYICSLPVVTSIDQRSMYHAVV